MTSEEKAAIEKALEEFVKEPGVDVVTAVVQNRELLPEAFREKLEMAAGMIELSHDHDEQDHDQDQDQSFEQDEGMEHSH